MMLKRLILFLVIASFLPIKANFSRADDWRKKISAHFIFYYRDAPDDFVEKAIDAAEDYYRQITRDLGFTFSPDWSWDNRAKIYIYNDADEYSAQTGQPSWSSGVSSYRDKVINTYPLAAGFFDTLLPHELGHIVFREFVGFRRNIPLWLDEGVACYQEKAKRWGVNKIVKKAIEQDKFIPLQELSEMSLVGLDRDSIELFYAESGSIIYFLITKYGKYSFISFCRALKRGDKIDKAINSAYGRFDNLEELNKAWVRHLKNE